MVQDNLCLSLCANCEKPITGRFLMHVLDKPWHAECLRCSDCGTSLQDKCFTRDAKIFCRQDFFRRFGTKCYGCREGISPQDMVRKSRDQVFHLKCFTCCVCSKQLATGDQLYAIGENRFICKEDYYNFISRTSLQGSYPENDETTLMNRTGPGIQLSPSSLPGDERSSLNASISPVNTKPPTPITSATTLIPMSDIDKIHSVPSVKQEDHSDEEFDTEKDQEDDKNNGDKSDSKRRGPRTAIKSKELEVLKNAFNKNPKPTRTIREQLTKETGLPMRVVQVWFQNKRSKERRMKQQTHMGMHPYNFGGDRALPRGCEDPYLFPGYGGFPPQQFPFFPPGQQLPLDFNNMVPGMEQPLPPGGPMFMVPPELSGPPSMPPMMRAPAPFEPSFWPPNNMSHPPTPPDDLAALSDLTFSRFHRGSSEIMAG